MFFILLTISIALMVAGSTLFIIGNTIYGIIILLLGAFMLIGTVIYYHNRKKNTSRSNDNCVPSWHFIDCDCDGGDCDCSPDCN